MPSARTRTPFFMTNAVANPLLITLLRGPLGHVLGRHLAVVDYVGRRTGRRHRLVAQYSVDGPTVRIHVGAADRKTWWRNFERPAPLSVRLAGIDHETTAHAVSHGSDVVVEFPLAG
jgi:hypothetical protein